MKTDPLKKREEKERCPVFLKTVMERNQPLVRLGIEWQQNGVILPDTYLLDYDTILENARSIKQAGDANGVQNFSCSSRSDATP